MKTLCPTRKNSFGILTPRVRLLQHPFDGLSGNELLDAIALADAKRRQQLLDSVQATGLNGTFHESFFVSEGDFTAVSTTSAETSLLAGSNKQPTIPANYFLGPAAAFRGFSILARGVLGTTSTPTLIFQVRTSPTVGATTLSGTSLGVSAAITTGSGVTNKWWELRLDMICTARGQGTGNATLSGSGYVDSPGGFASPFKYPLQPTTPDTATWTATFDAALAQYLNISATWSASNASNSIQCKQLHVWAFG